MTSTSQAKARYYTRLDERDYLGITVWPGKTDPSAEVIVYNLDVEMETIGKLLEG